MADEEQKTKVLTKNPLGPSGEAVAENIERLIGEKNLTFAALSKLLTEMKRPIPPLGLRKIVGRTRRVDADDLVALAAALDVSPVTLLMPNTEHGRDEVQVTGSEHPVGAQELWFWLRADTPLFDDRLPIVFHDAAWPRWRLRQRQLADEKALLMERVAESLADPDRAEKLREIFEVSDGDD